MKRTTLRSIAISGILFSLLAFDLPKGWFKAGSKPNAYEMQVEKGKGPDGKNAATLRSIEKHIKGFGTLMQQSKPDKFLGKRIRMTGYVRSENVNEWAGLWLRVDQTGSREPLSFDNMHNRGIKGTTDWKKYEIVLDVPNDASLIAYGALLNGTGQLWFTNITFEVVHDAGKSTNNLNVGPSVTVDEPTNLDFAK